jgi:uncharacterized membrane protein YkoI
MVHLALPFLTVAFVLAGPALRADDMCIDDWSMAAPVVKAEGLASVEAVTKLARSQSKGDVVKVTLCMQGSKYVYRMLVRGADGRHSLVIVDAKHPFAR